MSSEFGHGNKVPGISELHDVDRGWLLRPGSSRILSANVTWVLWDVTIGCSQCCFSPGLMFIFLTLSMSSARASCAAEQSKTQMPTASGCKYSKMGMASLIWVSNCGMSHHVSPFFPG